MEDARIRVVYPYGEGSYALPEDSLDTFFMTANAAYERVIRALNSMRPAELQEPSLDDNRPEQA